MMNQRVIFILGVSGSGKTRIGQMLAGRMDLQFLDADATVSMIAAAGLTAPLLAYAELSPVQIACAGIAISAGATTLSHVNDSGFWLVSQYLGLTERQTIPLMERDDGSGRDYGDGGGVDCVLGDVSLTVKGAYVLSSPLIHSSILSCIPYHSLLH